nr:occlusion-derived virus enveloped-capsid 43 [Calliteara abietis nucleopolyhedrovirus]
MSCPKNIKVCISSKFFLFPYEYAIPQNDVGNVPVTDLIVYVPTDEDVQYVNKAKLKAFASVRVLRHENNTFTETRLARKNTAATIIYWNPIVPIDEVGVGETRVFTVFLTNDLFFCKAMVMDPNAPLCPIESRNRMNYKKMIPIEGEQPLFYLNKMLDDTVNDFIICFKLETPMMVKILNIKKILSIFEYRKVAAHYAIYLPDQEVDGIFLKLNWERVRRLMKGDTHKQCSHVDRGGLQYLKLATNMLGIGINSKVLVHLVNHFQPLIKHYQLVPDVIIKLNTLDKHKRVRLYCKHDTCAITSYGLVPLNMPDDNPYAFDYSDINNNQHLYKIIAAASKSSNVNSLKIVPANYNYFF